MATLPFSALVTRIAPLKLMAFDVDGVLTDGRLYYSSAGVEAKAFSTQDGQGIRLLREAGIKLAIISARRSDAVEQRARDLGLHYCFQGVEAKFRAFTEMLAELTLTPAQAGYMGDDLRDLRIIRFGERADAVRQAGHAALDARVIGQQAMHQTHVGGGSRILLGQHRRGAGHRAVAARAGAGTVIHVVHHAMIAAVIHSGVLGKPRCCDQGQRCRDCDRNLVDAFHGASPVKN